MERDECGDAEDGNSALSVLKAVPRVSVVKRCCTVSDDQIYAGPPNFLALDSEHSAPERSRAWVLPVPYEATTTYGAGTRNGPAAIIAASREVELYDREFGSECALVYGVHTLPPLTVTHASPEGMAARVEKAVGEILSGRPSREGGPEVLAVLGGEHGVSPGVVRALAGRPGDELVVVQIDAHADLRQEYQGSPHSHACAARRIIEHAPVFQIGIRNISAEGAAFARDSGRLTTVWAEEATSAEPAFLTRLAAFCRGRRVYLTIDLDGLDPSIMPAVGTPEPGGLSWGGTLEIARTVAREAAALPAFDVVELAPVPGLAAPDFLAARLAYKIMSLAILGERA